MINPIIYILKKIDESNFETLKKYIALYLLLLIATLGGIYGIFFFTRKNTYEYIEKLHKKKKEIESLIEERKRLIEKKNYINSFLSGKELFRLKDYLYSIFHKYNFLKYVVSNNESITEQKVRADYVELQMNIEMDGISTSEMLEILAVIENDIRVYIKNIAIKNLQNRKLHLTISVATLQLIS